MTRDESILVALLVGDRSTGDLGRTTGLPERVCRSGLHRLIGADYVWSPVRGRYRLTHRGRVIAAEIIPDAGPEPPRRRFFGRSRSVQALDEEDHVEHLGTGV